MVDRIGIAVAAFVGGIGGGGVEAEGCRAGSIGRSDRGHVKAGGRGDDCVVAVGAVGDRGDSGRAGNLGHGLGVEGNPVAVMLVYATSSVPEPTSREVFVEGLKAMAPRPMTLLLE